MERGCSNVRIDGIAQLGAIRRSKFHYSFHVRYAIFCVSDVGQYIGVRLLVTPKPNKRRVDCNFESRWLSFILACFFILYSIF